MSAGLRSEVGDEPPARAILRRVSAAAQQIPLSRVIGALSYALDVTEGEPPGHAARTCKIGMRLAEAIGLDAGARSHLFYALLLKDAGCSANSAKMAALFGADDHVAKRTSKRIDWSGACPRSSGRCARWRPAARCAPRPIGCGRSRRRVRSRAR